MYYLVKFPEEQLEGKYIIMEDLEFGYGSLYGACTKTYVLESKTAVFPYMRVDIPVVPL